LASKQKLLTALNISILLQKDLKAPENDIKSTPTISIAFVMNFGFTKYSKFQRGYEIE